MSTDVNFSSNQIAAIEWLATSKYERVPPSQKQLAAKLGIREETICRWKRDNDFMAAITARARELLGSNLPEIYAALNREGEKGSFQHIKLIMEMTGEYSPKQEIEHSGEVKIKGYATISPDDWDTATDD